MGRVRATQKPQTKGKITLRITMVGSATKLNLLSATMVEKGFMAKTRKKIAPKKTISHL